MPAASQCARFPSPDTTLGAARVYYEMFERMTPRQRLAKLSEMERSCEIMAAEGVRRRHPQYNERQVWLARARTRLGPDLFALAFPDSHELL